MNVWLVCGEGAVDRLLEVRAKNIVSDIEMAEMYKRSVDHERYDARLRSRLEGSAGGVCTGAVQFL